jgi:hypothetical protein
MTDSYRDVSLFSKKPDVIWMSAASDEWAVVVADGLKSWDGGQCVVQAHCKLIVFICHVNKIRILTF